MMQVDQNNDPILLDELPAINGYVSSIVRTSSDTFITGSQDCTFRGWEIRDDQFIGNFNILTEAPIKCVSINQDHTLTGKLFSEVRLVHFRFNSDLRFILSTWLGKW